ncbi:early nodulin-93-like [Rhododendron vialii]|uniref:early nodulin-93-like n=1 Tax=Rhododendron vialii TaxID=182163 RepID=UPI00265F9905|nr:early nodulin-93-like [Rhododendron vialii]
MVDANSLLICSSSPGKGEDRIKLYPLDEGVRAGVKVVSIACVATVVPTLVAVRVLPWAKANLNYTAQALIISAASIAAYFITADKTILECARRNTHYNDKSA